MSESENEKKEGKKRERRTVKGYKFEYQMLIILV